VTKQFFLTIFLSLACHTISLASDDLVIMTQNYAPYNYTEDGKVTGFSGEIVRSICKKLNIPDNIIVYPWNRAYQMVQKDKNHVLFSMYRTDEREKLFKWVGPLIGVDQVFFAFKKHGIKINSLEEAKNAGTIVVQKNSNIQLFLEAQGFKNFYASASGYTLKMFIAGRGILWPASIISGRKYLMDAGVGDEVEPVYKIKKDFIYIAFNPQTSDEIILKWQKALNEIKQEPIYVKTKNKFLKKYMD
jgi:polar amino acid transport system substrate-binding protein